MTPVAQGPKDGAPGVKEIHIAADRAEGFAAEKVIHRRLTRCLLRERNM